MIENSDTQARIVMIPWSTTQYILLNWMCKSCCSNLFKLNIKFLYFVYIWKLFTIYLHIQCYIFFDFSLIFIFSPNGNISLQNEFELLEYDSYKYEKLKRKHFNFSTNYKKRNIKMKIMFKNPFEWDKSKACSYLKLLLYK